MVTITKETLIRYCDLIDFIADTNRSIKRTEDDIARIDRKLRQIDAGERVTDKVYGGEGGWQGFIIEGIPVPEYERCKTILLTKKARLKAEYEQLAEHKMELEEQRVAIQKLLREIKDPHIKRIVSYRCLEQMPWEQIAFKMGGGNTEASVKQAFWRYVNKNIL